MQTKERIFFVPISFKLAQITDLPQIVRIYNQTIKLKNVTADLKPVTVEQRQLWFAEFSPNKYPLWIITDINENIVGWVGLEAFYGRAAYQQTAEISIYLDESCRGQHIGSQALDFVETQLEKLQLCNIVAFVFKQNTASNRLFKKHHFEQWGLLPQVAQIDNKTLDLAILGKHYV